MPVVVNLTGRKFGRLSVVKKSRFYNRKGTMWECICDCGVEIITITDRLTTGHTQSCGCLHNERKTNAAIRHGHTRKGHIHQDYHIWIGMKTRCLNKNSRLYKNYGGRGIKICERWLESNGIGFINFIADMGPRPSLSYSLERVNNNGGYNPGNCKWATNSEQANNKRTNKRIIYGGESFTVAQFSRKVNLIPSNVARSLRLGYSPEEIVKRSRGRKNKNIFINHSFGFINA